MKFMSSFNKDVQGINNTYYEEVEHLKKIKNKKLNILGRCEAEYFRNENAEYFA